MRISENRFFETGLSRHSPPVKAGRPLPRLIHHPSVARGRQAQWLWRFATERTAGVLACPVRMRDRAKRRRRGPEGATGGRVVNKAGLRPKPAWQLGNVCLVVAGALMLL